VYGGPLGKAPAVLDFTLDWRCVVYFMPRPSDIHGETPETPQLWRCVGTRNILDVVVKMKIIFPAEFLGIFLFKNETESFCSVLQDAYEITVKISYLKFLLLGLHFCSVLYINICHRSMGIWQVTPTCGPPVANYWYDSKLLANLTRILCCFKDLPQVLYDKGQENVKTHERY